MLGEPRPRDPHPGLTTLTLDEGPSKNVKLLVTTFWTEKETNP